MSHPREKEIAAHANGYASGFYRGLAAAVRILYELDNNLDPDTADRIAAKIGAAKLPGTEDVG